MKISISIFIKVHTATRWTIRHSLMLHWFADLMNVTEEVTIHTPNVSTLLSSADKFKGLVANFKAVALYTVALYGERGEQGGHSLPPHVLLRPSASWLPLVLLRHQVNEKDQKPGSLVSCAKRYHSWLSFGDSVFRRRGGNSSRWTLLQTSFYWPVYHSLTIDSNISP